MKSSKSVYHKKSNNVLYVQQKANSSFSIACNNWVDKFVRYKQKTFKKEDRNQKQLNIKRLPPEKVFDNFLIGFFKEQFIVLIVEYLKDKNYHLTNLKEIDDLHELTRKDPSVVNNMISTVIS